MNKLWRIGNHLSKMGWVPRKISRILELINPVVIRKEDRKRLEENTVAKREDNVHLLDKH